MMIGFGDRVRTQQEVCNLFNASHPDQPAITRSTVSKIESKFVEHGHVRDLHKERPAKVFEDSKLDVLLETHNNPHVVVRTISRNCNLSSRSVSQILWEAKRIILISSINT